ncbi:DUF3488 and transglutaminase-like domain-containing protein [Streptomyces sp. 7-21]|jgi:transglutaminase-like putative cysteine protease|uniref:transglutaminase TgpA family protein n=1 Tax=Streptomyces sp. 7-21 TaxID=2802283 RepID=UPI0019202AAB|nr:DUF3488 and transglutaminase-like domain-containing protein [Streptomyces sp. 7-21]MBL1066766.1 transglutaminase [Streptomyces sp. 7-21]
MSYGTTGARTGGALRSGLRLAGAAWLATMAAASALLPLVTTRGWLVEAGALLAAQTATGLGLRWRELPRAVVAAGQALVSLVLLTAMTVPDEALAGLVPGPEAFGELGVLLDAGADDIGRYVAPAPVTDGIRLMLLGGVLLVGLLVDILAVTLRAAAASGLPLLAMYSVAAGVSPGEDAWPYFLCAAAGYLLLVLAEGRDRLARWGRYFPAPGPPALGAASGPRVRTGRRIGALTLGVAAVTPLLLPGLGDGLLGLNERDGAGRERQQDITAVNPVVALQDHLNQPEDRPVLDYRTDAPDPGDLYLRLIALDEFDGEAWHSSEWHESGQPAPPWPVPGLTQPGPDTVTTRIQARQGYAQTSLPVPYPAVSVIGNGTWLSGWLYDRGSQTLVSPDPEATVAGRSWEVTHRVPDTSPETLANAPRPPDEVLDYYTRVPDSLPPEVRETALSVTEGAASDYERAVALQEWFTRDGGFRYDTSVASGSGSEAIVNFLNDREGFCVHFAFTMAAMARTLDIPAQVAVGFTPGQRQPDGSYEVGIHNAHAWPELYFEGVGWVRFEPTPGQGTTPDYTRPEEDPVSPDPSQRPEETERPEDEETAPEPSPTPSPEQPEGCDPVTGECADDAQPRTPESDDDGAGLAVSWPLVLGGGGGLLAVALAMSPLLWRRRGRARRLGAETGALPAWRELTDTAWDFGVTPVVSETPRQAAQRIVRVRGLEGESAAAVHRVADAVEYELYAPGGAGASGQLAADVRAASDGMRAASGRWERLRALLLPRSAMRVMHAAAARRIALTERLGATLRRALPGRRGHAA